MLPTQGEITQVPDTALEANPCQQPAGVHIVIGRGAGGWGNKLELIVEKLAFFGQALSLYI